MLAGQTWGGTQDRGPQDVAKRSVGVRMSGTGGSQGEALTAQQRGGGRFLPSVLRQGGLTLFVAPFPHAAPFCSPAGRLRAWRERLGYESSTEGWWDLRVLRLYG